MASRTVEVHKYNNSEPLSLMNAFEINVFLAGGCRSVYAPANENGMTYRIIQARTHKGQIQGRTTYDVGDNGWISLESKMCRTCGRLLCAPYRNYLTAWDGTEGTKILMGCVAVDHTGHLTSQDDQDWHDRPDAVRMREVQQAKLEAM